jgi:hypothetical protein
LKGAFDVIPRDLLVQLAVPQNETCLIEVLFTAVGTQGGDDVETNEFYFPVQVCSGCLVKELLANCVPEDEVDDADRFWCGIPQDTEGTCCVDGGDIDCYSK